VIASLVEPPATAGRAPQRAPAFRLATRNGTVSLDSLRGRVVLVDFWASWCEPCRKSFPWLKSLHDRYGTQGLTIVAVDLDKDRDAADAFLAQYPAPFIVAFDPAGKTAEAFKVSAMPSSYLLSPTGEILHAHAGYDPRKSGTIESLIKETCSR
jgi:cytochrome c biogenesis protein CcmG/thiol:disulfide interchange protein DsbE